MEENWQGIETPHERLQWARRNAGYAGAIDAAEAMGAVHSTYLGHENGSRGLARAARRYADFFKVSLDWLLAGKGSPKARMSESSVDAEIQREIPKRRMIPIVGYVGAGAAAHPYAVDPGQLEHIEAPEGSTDRTKALEIKGDSLGALFDRWVLTYDDVRTPVSPDQINRICIVGLADDRVLVKKIKLGRDGLFALLSATEPQIEDAAVTWAARVMAMVPKD